MTIVRYRFFHEHFNIKNQIWLRWSLCELPVCLVKSSVSLQICQAFPAFTYDVGCVSSRHERGEHPSPGRDDARYLHIGKIWEIKLIRVHVCVNL